MYYLELYYLKLWVVWYAVLTTEHYITTVTRVNSGGMKSLGWDEGVNQNIDKKIYKWVQQIDKFFQFYKKSGNSTQGPWFTCRHKTA